MTKSFTTIETHICPVCGKEHETGALLLDKKLEERFEHKTATGYSLCEEHQKLYDEGYIHLVVATNNQSSSNLRFEDANRTGEIISIKSHIFQQIFNKDIQGMEMVFIEEEVAELIKSRIED